MPSYPRRASALFRAGIAVLAGCTLAACVSTPPAPPSPGVTAVPPVRYRAVSWADIPGWREDRVEAAWTAFRMGCKVLATRAATAERWGAVCAAAASLPASGGDAARAFFETHFSPYEIAAADGALDGLVTGYYEPILHGSRERTPRFGVPLYGTPADLLTVELAGLHPELAGRRVRGRVDGRKVVPYWSRSEIMGGRQPAAPVLAYVEHAIDAFFLEIQGSGRVTLADGTMLRLGYADQNGHPYKAVGRVLADRGAIPIEQMSMQAIRDWASRHADQVPALLAENPSYVFFREVPPPAAGSLEAQIDGPIGALGVPLAAGRAIAVDPRAIPLGSPVFVATTDPDGGALRRLVLAQDTGGAIRGAVRADLFFGTGAEAASIAGRMKQRGRMWLLWPKGMALPAS